MYTTGGVTYSKENRTFGTLGEHFGTLMEHFGTLMEHFGTLVEHFGTLTTDTEQVRIGLVGYAKWKEMELDTDFFFERPLHTGSYNSKVSSDSDQY